MYKESLCLIYEVLLLLFLEGRIDSEQCSAEIALQNHEVLFKQKPNFNYYLPKLSCIMCSNLTCNFSSPQCDKKSELNFIPLYHNLIEFGFFGNDMPKDTQASITYSNDCFHKITISKGENEIEFSMKECFTATDECYHNFYRKVFKIFDIEQSCFFVAIGYHSPGEVNIDYSTTCYHAPSENFSSSPRVAFKIFQNRCNFRKGYDAYVCYTFFQDDNRKYDGAPLIVPCSSGGYPVDPYTGRFVINERCKKIFQYDSSSDAGLPYIINKFFYSDENLLFPTIPEGTLLPVYVANTQNKLYDRDQLKASSEPNLKMTNLVRINCEYGKQGTKVKLSNSSVDKIINSSKRKKQARVTLKPFNDEALAASNIDEKVEVVNSNLLQNSEGEEEKFKIGHCSKNGSHKNSTGRFTSKSSCIKPFLECVIAGIIFSIFHKE